MWLCRMCKKESEKRLLFDIFIIRGMVETAARKENNDPVVNITTEKKDN